MSTPPAPETFGMNLSSSASLFPNDMGHESIDEGVGSKVWDETTTGDGTIYSSHEESALAVNDRISKRKRSEGEEDDGAEHKHAKFT